MKGFKKFSLLLFCSASVFGQTVSMQSLLKEMVNREKVAQLPVPSHKNVQASSYDRNSKSPDKGWFANGDRSFFVRVDKKDDGRHEHVMMEVNEPGAIVRFWNVTCADKLLKGKLRIYIDDKKTPMFSGTLEDLIGGNFFAEAPLSEELAAETEKVKRGRNLYLPIPFAKYCKVTYEKVDGKKLIEGVPAWGRGDAVFYNINYRVYPKGTKVRSISKDELKKSKAVIGKVNAILKEAASNKQITTAKKSLLGKVAAGKTKTLTIPAPSKSGGAIKQLHFKLNAENLPQALRSTVLEISFDRERTVWTPIGDFFGTGYQIRPSNHWYGSVDSEGNMICHWIMPFKKGCRLKIHNLGIQEVELTKATVASGPWKWTNKSMYFGSAWQQYTKIQSKPDRDLNYVTLEGEGIYIGDSLTLFDSNPKWWGEGDEKIFIDNEEFPSHFGTGSEDYYGYAWCIGRKFSHPFITQPDGSGNESVGFTINSRYRSLDGIPFQQKLHFDMELMHWKSSRLSFAPTVYWYARPGVKCNISPNPESAKLPVALTAEDITK